MRKLARVLRMQLQLPLENMTMYAHPIEQIRNELIQAFADLLREALGVDGAEESQKGGGADECKDYA